MEFNFGASGRKHAHVTGNNAKEDLLCCRLLSIPSSYCKAAG